MVVSSSGSSSFSSSRFRFTILYYYLFLSGFISVTITFLVFCSRSTGSARYSLLIVSACHHQLNLPPFSSFSVLQRHQPSREHGATRSLFLLLPIMITLPRSIPFLLFFPLVGGKTGRPAGKQAAKLGPKRPKSLANGQRQMNPPLVPMRHAAFLLLIMDARTPLVL
nr:hypothetical protein PanWU01x14_308160 [Ipomoea batatas]